MKVKEESEKAGLKLHIQKTKIIASGPITSRETDSSDLHTGYKACAAAVLLPCHKGLEKLATLTVKDGAKAHEAPLLDPRLMATPALALAQCRQRILECILATSAAFDDVCILFDRWDDSVPKKVHKVEEMADWYEDEIESYLADLSAKNMTYTETKELSRLLHVIANYENITDHIYRMVFSFKQLYDNDRSFSPAGRQEMADLNDMMKQMLVLGEECFSRNDYQAAFKIINLEHKIVRACAVYRENHIARLKAGQCTVRVGWVFTDLLGDYERIVDHLSKEARLTLVVASRSSNGASASRFLSQLLDQNPEIEERLKRALQNKGDLIRKEEESAGSEELFTAFDPGKFEEDSMNSDRETLAKIEEYRPDRAETEAPGNNTQKD